MNLHWPGEISSLYPGDYLRLHPTHLTNYLWQYYCSATRPNLCSWQGAYSTEINSPQLNYLGRYFSFGKLALALVVVSLEQILWACGPKQVAATLAGI